MRGPGVEQSNGGTSRPRRRWLPAGAIAVVVLAAMYGAASWYVYDRVGTAPGACWSGDLQNTPRSYATRDPADQWLADAHTMPAPEEVRFASRDPSIPDVELAGWWIPSGDPGGPAVVVVHGIQSCRREANVLVPAGMLHQAGFSVLLVDIRDHGDSGGDDGRFAGGSEEHLDVLGAWDWVRARGVADDRIGLLGVSFGAINSIIAGGQDRRVAAVWADSVATRLDDAIGNFVVDQLGDPTGMSRVLVPGAMAWARILAGDDLTRFNPVDELAAYEGRAVQFVHGGLDPVLPAAMASEMAEHAVAAGAVTAPAWIVPDAGHTEAVFVEPEAYKARMLAFFTAALAAP
jgi:uncharacterized protein